MVSVKGPGEILSPPFLHFAYLHLAHKSHYHSLRKPLLSPLCFLKGTHATNHSSYSLIVTQWLGSASYEPLVTMRQSDPNRV